MRRSKKRQRVFLKIMCLIMVMAVAVGAVIWSFYLSDNYNGILGYKVTMYSKAGGESVVNLDEYIEGVVISLVPADYEYETIKAMSVVVRTYIMQQANENENGKINVDDLDLCSMSLESLKGALGADVYKETMEKYDNAIKATKGKVMTYQGNIIVPMYHMASNGMTRDAKEVIGVDAGYLIAQNSNWDVTCEEYLKVIEIEVTELKDKVGEDVAITRKDSSGYVLEVSSSGGTMTGEEFASKFDLNSSSFTIEYSDDKQSVKLVTKGKGHGLGLSIYGANELAKKGKTCDEILKYYYYGIKIE